MRHSVPLPGTWAEASLRDIAWNLRPRSSPSDHPGLRFVGMDSVEAETTRLLGTVPASSMKSAATHFQPGDVLYGRLRPYLNKIFTAQFEGLASAEFIPLTPPAGVHPEFVKYRLNSAEFVAFTSRLDTGDRPRVDYEQIGNFAVALPPSPEQHRIVEAIESYLTRLDNAVALLKRVEQNLKRYRASVLKAAVEGRLVPTEAELARREGRSYEPASELLKRILAERKARWIEDAAEKTRAKAEGKARRAGQLWTAEDDAATLERERAKAAKQYKEPAAPDTADLPELPEGWSYMSVGQFCAGAANSIKRGPFGSALRKEFFVPSGFKVYEQQHAIRNDFSIGSYYVDREKFEELRAFEVCPGDLIVSCSGTIGRVAVVPEWAERGIINQALLKLTLDQQVISNVFFIISFQALATHLVADTSRGTGMQNLSGVKELKLVGFPVPPLDEQGRIVAAVERQDSVIFEVCLAVGQALRRVRRLRQAILKWAFEGKLVEQDPNDEPASVILEQIRAKRVAAGADKPGARKRRSAE